MAAKDSEIIFIQNKIMDISYAKFSILLTDRTFIAGLITNNNVNLF